MGVLLVLVVAVVMVMVVVVVVVGLFLASEDGCLPGV